MIFENALIIMLPDTKTEMSKEELENFKGNQFLHLHLAGPVIAEMQEKHKGQDK